jgi:hypothetical protein
MGMPHLKIILTVLFPTELAGGYVHALYELSWWQTDLPIVSSSSSIKSIETQKSIQSKYWYTIWNMLFFF